MDKDLLKSRVAEMDGNVKSIFNQQNAIRKEIEALIFDMIQKQGNKIDFNDEEYEDYDLPLVSFDGGNYGKWMSDISKEVIAIKPTMFMERKSFEIDFDDYVGYEAWHLNFDDVSEIFDYLKHIMYYGEI